MLLHAVALLAQAATTQLVLPVLAFPEPGMDDPAAYQGYQTRFFRDAAGNTVQIYLDQREGRAVHVWANAENESIGFTARDGRGAPANLRWDSEGAHISRTGRIRIVEYSLTTDARRIDLGWFLLGSMRVERDFQAAGRHRAPFTAARYTLPELQRLIASLERLPSAERREHVALLGARELRTLRMRLHPSVVTRRGTTWEARVVQPSLDGRDTLVLEVRTDSRRVTSTPNANSIVLRARAGAPLAFSIRIGTTGAALTPIARADIFTPEFLAFLAAARSSGAAGDSAAIRARWLERHVRGVELLASREKLMAGLPTYGTYFGRDMLVAALMMRPIWRDAMSEFVIASALRKLSPTGQVSHEEALGGQAVRESAAEYAMLVDAHLRAARRGERIVAESLLVRAREVLRNHRLVRENYHMIDDELQFPVLVARWMGTADVTLDHQRAFLRDSSDGGATRLVRLLRELALVARMTEAYAREPNAAHLVSFAPRDSGRWASTSWRDSNAGYGGGRYAMDVNAIWAPHALQSMQRILAGVRALGFSIDSLAAQVPELRGDAPLARYARDSLALRRAIDVWRGAWRHFMVRLRPADVRSHVTARLAAMPPVERAHWTAVLASTGADQDSLAFLALALDGSAQPIGIANSDPGTRLFLGEPERTSAGGDSLGIADVLRDVRLFVRAYPVGLFIDRVGPVVANDAFAPPAVWRAFERDPYHGPRVAWGREVNLFLLGVASRIEAARGAGLEAYVRELRAAADRVVSAVEASGFQSELWSYRFEAGRPVPVRYGSGADVQLWSTTDLAVQFALSRLKR